MSRKNAEKNPKLSEAFRIKDFTFSMTTCQLVRSDGTGAHLRKQTAEVLRHLLRNAGEVVTKDTLFGAVWAETAVTDDSLVQCVSEIRRALGDHDHSIVQTVSKTGYKIMASPVVVSDNPDHPMATERPSIAVLAFDDFSAGHDSGFLSDAIPEGIIAELSRFPELTVSARNSSFLFRSAPERVEEISRRLGVRYILEGSQQKSANRLRVTVQLIDAPLGSHLWSEVYENDLHDLLTAQDDIVSRIVAAVAQKIAKVEVRGRTGPDQPARTALQLHLEARQHLIKFTPESNERAKYANLAAIRADPDQPYGYVGLAFVLLNDHRWGRCAANRSDALKSAREAAQKGLELGPDYYDSHAAMANVHLEENDLDRAIARARRALDLNPNDINIMCDLADFLAYDGRYEDAEILLKKAIRMDPFHPDWVRWTLGWVQWLSGKSEQALQTMSVMAETPPMAHRVLALVHTSLGQMPEAGQAIQRVLDHDPDYSMADIRRDYAGKFKTSSDLERVVDGLRAAGLPD